MEISKIKKHLPHYLVLIVVFILGLLAFMLFSYDRNLQITISVSMAISYVVWGIMHHLMHKDLYALVVIEYITIASLGLLIILSLISQT